MNLAAPGEFSRPVALDRATPAPHGREIVAAPEERAALARRLGLLSLERLAARVSWRRQAGGVICLEGELEAALSQSCVVTLEPVEAQIAERFVRYFVREASKAEAEVMVDPEADDPPEPLVDGVVDLGEIVAEQLALALDPYPRAPRSGPPVAPGAAEEAPQAMVAESPFRVLEALKTER